MSSRTPAAPAALPFASIAVVGTGLVGGSLLRDLAELTGCALSCYDLDPRVRAAVAREMGSRVRVVDSLEALAGAELVFLATPVGSLEPVAAELVAHLTPGTVLTDVGSVKAAVVEPIESLCGHRVEFVGGHPMAGREVSGWSSSVRGLFTGATWVLTPTQRTDAHASERLSRVVGRLGVGRIVEISPSEHDGMVGAVSHLPQLVASALATVIARVEARRPGTMELAGTGYRDTTRIAASAPEMWSEIVAQNAEVLAPLVAEVAECLNELAHDLGSAEAAEAAHQLVAAGRAGRAQLAFQIPPIPPG